MSNLPCPHKDIGQAPKQPAYSVLPAICSRPGCGRQAEEEHHTVPKHYTRSWKERDWALLYGHLVPIKVPLCRHDHDLATRNVATVLWNGQQFLWNYGGEINPLNFTPLDRGLGLEPPSLPSSEAPVEREPNPVERTPSHAPGVGTVGTEPSRSIKPVSHLNSPEKNFSIGIHLGGDQDESSSQSPVSSGAEIRTPMESGIAPGARWNASGSASDISPGDTCPTCDRRVPHQRSEAAPKTTKQLNLGHAPADVVPRLKDRLDDFALSAGITEKAYHRVKALDLLLIIAAQISAEALEGYAAHVDEELGWAA